MIRLAVAAAALTVAMTSCGSGLDSVDGVIDTLGCSKVTVEKETLAKAEKVCTLPSGKRVWVVETEDKASADLFVSMAAEFGMAHAPLTDTLYVATKDYPTLQRIGPKLGVQVSAG